MKKEQIYVPIANKKEAKRAKSVLEAMGEKVYENFYLGNYNKNNGGLYFNEEFETWCIALAFGTSKTPNHRTVITLKQLIELLVSDQQTEPEKIAVRVDNEKEFNALMKYYDSLGWKSIGDVKPLEAGYLRTCWSFHDNFGHAMDNFYTEKGYKIMPFSEFSKEHGIRVHIGVSKDGVDIYSGDTVVCVNIEGGYIGNDQRTILSEAEFHSNTHYRFSTLQAALDWIEAQKPKVIEYNVPSSNYTLSITKDEVRGFEDIAYLDLNDIKAIHKAMEELNS